MLDKVKRWLCLPDNTAAISEGHVPLQLSSNSRLMRIEQGGHNVRIFFCNMNQ